MKMFVLLVLSLCGAPMVAQSGWSRVEALRPGTMLVVTTWHRAPCVLEDVSNEGMACAFRGRVYWVDRARIVRVSRLGSNKAVLIGTAVGAAVGGSLVAAHDPGDDPVKGLRIVAGAGLGGACGFLLGHLGDRAEGEVLYYGAP